MKKIFKTNIDDFEILDLIIEYFQDDNLRLIIDENPLLKFSCIPEGGKRFRFNRDVVEVKVKEFIRKDRKIRISLLKMWEKIVVNEIKEIDFILTTEDMYTKLSKGKTSKYIFRSCTILWQKNKLDLNKCGDKLYEIYKEKINSQNEEFNDSQAKIEEIGMNNDIMSLTLGECIQELVNAKKEIIELNEKVKEKENESQKLKSNLDSIIDNRDLKKEIKFLSKRINEVDLLIKEENEKLNTELCEIKKENVELRKKIEAIDKSISSINMNTLIKTLSESQNNFNNTLKGGLVEIIQKNMEIVLLGLEERLLKKLEEKDNKYNNTPSIEVKEEGSDKDNNFNTLIESILL
ncbi:hypothetical protein [Clostridium sp. K04]|uniref:coiled-coil domain-containing protein n=1 Tax=Clostridium sp. K04 TaxID=2718929 RepID=UPI001C8B4EAC|nr:hypothetical protein [Clostridium sp. K04]MBX9184570.1 hypothetical protein [Clostridium sp. K04]